MTQKSQTLKRCKQPCLLEKMDGHCDGTAPATTPMSPSSGRRISRKDDKNQPSFPYCLVLARMCSLGKPHSAADSCRDSFFLSRLGKAFQQSHLPSAGEKDSPSRHLRS